MSNTVWALVVDLAPTDSEPDIRNLDLDAIPELLGGVTVVHGYRNGDGSTAHQPRIRFHTTAADQQPGTPVNWIATLLHHYYNHGLTHNDGLLRGRTVIVTGWDPDTGTDIDVPEDVIDSHAVIADHQLSTRTA